MLRVKVIYLDIIFYMWNSSKRNIKSKRKKGADYRWQKQRN